MNQAGSIQIKSGQLMLRQAPDSQSPVLARLSKNRPVQVLAEAGNWYRIRAGNQQGYAAKAYIALSSPLPEPAASGPIPSDHNQNDFQVAAGQLTLMRKAWNNLAATLAASRMCPLTALASR